MNIEQSLLAVVEIQIGHYSIFVRGYG